jgi:hypothetical protein
MSLSEKLAPKDPSKTRLGSSYILKTPARRPWSESRRKCCSKMKRLSESSKILWNKPSKTKMMPTKRRSMTFFKANKV